MYFDLSDEQRSFVKTVEDFSRREIAPGAVERDRAGEWYAAGWRKMGQLGLLGLQFPEAYGGSGADIITTAAAFQAFTAGGADAGIALSWVAHSVLAGTPLWLFGNDEQKRRYLAPIATGEWTAGYGLTEPSAGSDAASMLTTAVQRGDRWILNGSKMFITNAPVGDVFVVFASEDRSLRSRGVTAFIVERGFPGFSSGRELDKMGNRTSPTGELIFQDCEVPLENVLGERRKGFDIAKAALEWERFLMMAHSIGTMQALLADCVGYARERKQFGQPIASQPAIQAKLAEMWLSAAAGELFVRRVAWMKDQGLDAPVESSSCKIFCSGAVMQAARQAVQVFGGYGYIRENAVERSLRDAKLAEIGGGTTEIQRQVVGRRVAAGDTAWDMPYTPEQAARTRPAEQAPDLTAAALALAEQAKEGLAPALQAMAGAAVRWTLRLSKTDPAALADVQDASVRATYSLDGHHAVDAGSADVLLTAGGLYRKPADWEVESLVDDQLLPGLEIGRIRLLGPGSGIEQPALAAVSRLLLAAVACGLCEAALDEAVQAARTNHLESSQLIEFELADIRTRTDGARMLVHRAAASAGAGKLDPDACRAARVFAAEAAVFCIDRAVAVAGVFGSSRLQQLQREAHLPGGLDSPIAAEQLAAAASLLATPPLA